MHTASVLAALAATIPFTLAAPAPNPAEDVAVKGFSVQQVPGPLVLKSGSVARAAALSKYGAPVPDNVAAAAASQQSGTVAASPEQYDQSYLCPVKIGSPAQTLTLDFDTGSADLWVFSSEQPSSQRSGHAYYTPGSSSTAHQESGETWKISYGDGSGAAGNIFADKVVIGAVTATSQAVEAATSVSSTFQQDTNNDGLVGLAFSSINTASPNQVTTFFDTVKASLPAQLFTATLKHGKPGAYDFGYINTTRYTGSIAYTPVDNSQGFWSISPTGYYIGSSYTSGTFNAIADTGTSLMLLDDSIVDAYWNQVDSAQYSDNDGGYIFDCGDTLPNFSIVINGAKRTVPGSYINYAPNGDGTCYGGLQSDSGVGFGILGDVFLKAQFVVFDMGNMRLGVATQTGVPSS